MILSLVAATFAFMAVSAVAAYLLTRRSGLGRAEQRLQRLARPSRSVSDSVEGGGLLRTGSSRFPLLRVLLSRGSLSDRWRLDLEQAGLHLKVSEYFLMRLLAGAIVGLLGMLFGGPSAVGLLIAVVGFLVGFMLPAVTVQLRKNSRRKAINSQLVEMIEMISNSLRSGFAFVQAVELAVKQLTPPIKDELEIFVSDASLGAKMDDALRGLAERTGSVDVELMVTSILIQRTSGGNLSEVLDNVAGTIRERERLQGDIRALTAQQRFTGIVLSFYPMVLAALFFAISPDLMKVLWEEEGGRILVVIAATLQLLGFLSIQRILKLEV